MSPAENTGRLVLVDQAQRDDWATLAGLMDEEGFNPEMVAGLRSAVAAFDAAPADPVVAVRDAVARAEYQGSPTLEAGHDYIARAVLVALGANEPASAEEREVPHYHSWPRCECGHVSPSGQRRIDAFGEQTT